MVLQRREKLKSMRNMILLGGFICGWVGIAGHKEPPGTLG